MELIASVPTPFTASGELDLDGAARTFRFAAARKASLFVAGTTGEFPSLDDDERLARFKVALEITGPERTIVHVGAADSRHAARLAATAVAHGATRLAAISPYYLPARPDEVAAYFAAVQKAAGDARVYAYLFPERTGATLTPPELSRVAGETGLAGVKLSGASAAQLEEYVRAAPAGFAVYTGDDSQVVEAARVGASGVVSGVSSAFPAPFAELLAAVLADEDEPDTRVTAEAVRLLGPSIGRLKYAQSLLGLAGPHARMAVDSPDAAVRAAIERLVPR